MMPAQWRIVGTSNYTKAERDVTAFELVGDVSRLLVPLRWPIDKVLEERLPFAGADQIRPFWQTLLAQSSDAEIPGYVAYPEDDDALREVYTTADGSPIEKFPWEADARPENWQALFAAWYRAQYWYSKRDLVVAFGEAVEALTGLPLEQSAPLLEFWLTTAASGEDVSESKPASISTGKKTAPRSGRPRTTSSPAASSAPKENTSSEPTG